MKSSFISVLKWIVPFCYLLTFAPFTSFSSESHKEGIVRQELTQIDHQLPVQADLITAETSIQPGQTFWIGVNLHLSKDWKTYWKNPGDSGAAPQVNWQLPEGFKISSIKWPAPQRFDEGGLTVYGYSHDIILLAQVTAPKNLPDHTNMDIGADVTWIACSDSCVPGNAHLSLTLPTSEKATPVNSSIEQQIKKAQQDWPQDLSPEQAQLSAKVEGNSIILHFQPLKGAMPEITKAAFYPENSELVNHQVPEKWNKSEQGYSLTLSKNSDISSSQTHLEGILLLTDHQAKVKYIQVNLPLDGSKISSGGDTTSHESSAISSLSLAMGLAFVGGLILNMMPCVLPVIALKIFGFVKLAQQRRITVLKHGGVYALGVLVSFWILSGALLILRAYGAGIGWGFQLQEPLFVVSLAIVLFLLGLSLFGVFELGASLITLGQRSSTSSPMTGTFFSGVLATLVATPCTGPLLGPALGYAVTLDPISALVVFTCMGLGMASPYLLFSAFPSLIRFLPKPGNWMITFKQVMGFLMMATVVWLIWVFAAQTGITAVFALIVALLILSIGAWIFGHWGTPMRKRIVRAIGIGLASLTIISGAGLAVYSAKNLGENTMVISQQESAVNGWQAFSPEKIQDLRKEGKAVFVDFTAKWCLICQANKVTLNSSDVTKAFNDSHVVKMVADWTKNDPSITKELQKFGRSGVPLYVLYPADPEKQPIILPQTLTSSIVADYLHKLDGEVVANQTD